MRAANHVEAAGPAGEGRVARPESSAPPPSLRRNIVWTFAGNLVFSGSRWAMIVVLAKLGSPAMVGQYGFAVAVCLPLIVFSRMSLRTVQATDVRQTYGLSRYLQLTLITTATAVLAIVVVVGLTDFGRATAIVILIVTLAHALESICEVLFGFFQQHERMDIIARSRILHGTLALVAFAVVLGVTRSLIWGTVALVAAIVAKLVAYDMPRTRSLLRQVGTGTSGSTPGGGADRGLLALAWLALPLGLVTLLVASLDSIPRYFLRTLTGEAELGVFVAMYGLLSVGQLVIGAVGNAATPRLARLYGSGEVARFEWTLARLIGMAAAMGASGLAIVWLAGPAILTFVYSAEFAGASDVFFLLMAAAAVRYIGNVLGTAVTSMRYFKIQLPIHCGSVAIVAAGCFLWVGPYGQMGAAWALFASTTFAMLCYVGIVVHGIRAGGATT